MLRIETHRPDFGRWGGLGWLPSWAGSLCCLRYYMLIVNVHVKVKPEHIEAFRTATVQNARCSIEEPGIARFDVLQQQDDPTRFLLVEAYSTDEAPARHKETGHYQRWRD